MNELKEGIAIDEFFGRADMEFDPNKWWGAWISTDSDLISEFFDEFFIFVPPKYQNDCKWIIKDKPPMDDPFLCKMKSTIAWKYTPGANS